MNADMMREKAKEENNDGDEEIVKAINSPAPAENV
jgi:hypothetical protein